jgi:hypothetical protein
MRLPLTLTNAGTPPSASTSIFTIRFLARYCSSARAAKLPKRNDAFLVSFSQHANGFLSHVDLVVVQAYKFTHPQTARVQQFQDGTISQPLQVLPLRQLDDRGRFVFREARRSFFGNLGDEINSAGFAVRRPSRTRNLKNVFRQASFLDTEVFER